MKHNKLIFILCIVCSLSFLNGCESTKDNGNNIEIEQQVRVYHQYGQLEFSTNDGYYHTSNNGYLYFFDYKSAKDVLVCSKANCKLDDQLNEESEAYVGFGAGFTQEDQLYVFQRNEDREKQFSLIKSNLDRSNQKELLKINSAVILNYAVIKQKVYIAIDEVILKEAENGAQVEEPKHRSYILAVDLKTGEQEVVTEIKENYNNTISILTADEKKIYLTYSYFENFFDGANFSEAIPKTENYVYDIESKKMTPILENKLIRNAYLSKDTLFTLEEEANNGAVDENAKYSITQYTLPDYQSKIIVSSIEYPTILDQEWVYVDSDGEHYSLNLKTKDIKKTTIGNRNGILIKDSAKDYYFVLHKVKDEMKNGFILKSDYEKGSNEIINIHK